MLRIIFTKNTLIRDVAIASLNLSKNPTQVSLDFQVYQKSDWILVYSLKHEIDTVLPVILENWDPDRLYLPYLGRSIDMMHEIGDVIMPNVFMSYDPQIELIDTDSEESPVIDVRAKFLDIYEEQKDYYVEDYGLSVGGIVVDNVPNATSINTALMMNYEGDIYIEDSLDSAYAVVTGDMVPALVICGIVEGKKSQHESGTPEQMAVRNIFSTIRLTEDDEE